MPRARLTRSTIVDACIGVMQGGNDLTFARLGGRLGVDPTAVYRHFRDKDELLRAVTDRILGPVTVGLPAGRPATWRTVVTEVCVRLRHAHLSHPRLAAPSQPGPPMQANEFAITEVLLTSLRAAGLSERNAALAYHALIELTVGSASLDAMMAGLDDDERDAAYAAWRRAYAALDPASHPTSVAVAPSLYAGTADERFRYALDRLLDGIAGSVGGGGGAPAQAPAAIAPSAPVRR